MRRITETLRIQGNSDVGGLTGDLWATGHRAQTNAQMDRLDPQKPLKGISMGPPQATSADAEASAVQNLHHSSF
jgi:hypothetical protein